MELILPFAFIILIFLPLIIKGFVKDPDKNEKYMKYYIWFFISSFFWIPALTTVIENIQENNTPVVADGFTIEGYEVILDVGVDNKVNVIENIDINFYESGHHGIYKFTPRWLEYTGQDGKTTKRKSIVSNYYAVGEKYTTDVVKDKDRIKIGSPYITVSGDHKYIIKYTYDMGKDPYDGFDEFIFHAFGDFWGTEIKNPKVVIHMPKDIDVNSINVFKDKYRKENINKYVNKEIDGNTITITLNDMRLFKSLTVDLGLPEGYFEGGSWNYGWISFGISMIVILATIYIFIMWYRHGKDYEKKVPTVEFYAPEDLSSAEVGYIYNNRHVSKKLTISLIIELASKGYIKIDEIKDSKNKKKIQITKLNIPPEVPTVDQDSIPKRIIEIRKIKNADDSLSKAAATQMEYYFKHGDTENLIGNRAELFLKYTDELVNGGYVSIISDNKKEVDLAYEKSGYEKKVAAYEKELAEYSARLEKLPKKTALENIVYGNLFSSKEVVILSEHTSFYKTFGQIENELKKNFQNKVHEDKSRKCKKVALIITFITLILSLLSFFYFEDLDPKWSMLYCVSFACVIVNVFLAIVMGRKTEYGEMISARIKGFSYG